MKGRLALGTSVAALALGLPGLGVLAQPTAVGEPIVMGEERSFQVHRPAHYDLRNDRYPVLIVLDGEEHFQQVSATLDFLAADGKVPSMLVIGIPNTDRFRDMDTAAASTSGSSPFLEFITDELIPKVDRDYRTRPYRILMGHSGAGLFALYSLINAPDAFRSYLVIAPAFGDHRELPKTVDTFLQEHPDPNLTAEVFLAADDSRGMQLSGAWELSSYLNERASRVRDLRFTFRRYAESHSTVPFLSVYEGLQNTFEGWELDMDEAFTMFEQGGLTAIDEHFAALSARLGFPVAVPDGALVGVFGNLESRKRFAEAAEVIGKVIESSPDDPAPLYYAGRVYMQMGNTALAVETLKKSLLLSPNYGPSRGLLQYMKVDATELVPEVHVSAAELARFVGGYGTSAVLFEVERRGDRIFGRTSDQEYELTALSATSFESNAGTLAFAVDDRGRVTGVEFQNGALKLAKLN
jgi:predicted alpha/beta superfamily hydrolase